MRNARIASVFSLAVLLSGCTYNPTFGFPIEEGDITAGRQAFIAHACHRCHSVAGEAIPPFPAAASPLFELGGPTSQVKSYSELVTSIINPDHRISEEYLDRVLRQVREPEESPMPMPYLEAMTVRQLIDLVAFLDASYILIPDYVPADRPPLSPPPLTPL